MAIERKIDGATFADLANTVRRLREKFADLPEDQEIAEAERATLEVREAMRVGEHDEGRPQQEGHRAHREQREPRAHRRLRCISF